MVNVFGKLPSSIDVSTISKDCNLFLLFNGMPVKEDIRTHSNVVTYIITDQPHSSALLQEYIQMGYHNILSGVMYPDLTFNLISDFLQSSYELNKSVAKGRLLNELYQNKKELFEVISGILLSLKNRDVATFHQLVKYNLISAVEQLNDIKYMLDTAQDVTGVQDKFKVLEAQLEVLQEQAKTANPEALELAQNTIRQLHTQMAQQQQQIQILEEDARKLSLKVASATASGADVVPLADYNKLLEDKRVSDAQVSAGKVEIATLTSRLASVETVKDLSAIPTDAFGQQEMIDSLRHELELVNNVPPDEKIKGMLPIITDSLMTKTPYILQFKEIKPAIYINSLIRWTTLLLKSAFVKEQRKAPLIVIFDPLLDQFRIKKYRKHGYSINSPPISPNFCVVTNDCNLLFIKETLHLQNYDFVIVIDRLGSLKNVADSEKTITYYLIDSPTDIVDFGLDPQACIGFYGADNSVKYFTEPSPTTAHIMGDKRISRIGQSGWINEILKGLGIIEIK